MAFNLTNMKRKKTTTAIPKSNPKKSPYVFLGITLGVLSLAGIGYWYFKGRKGTDTEEVNTNLTYDEPATPPKHIVSTPSKKSGFPLKLHSKGTLVKQLQEALLKKYGKSILPKYGADGDFGSELEYALASKSFMRVIDEAEYTKIMAALSTTTHQDYLKQQFSKLTNEVKVNVNITRNIWLYTTTKKLNELIIELKRIPDVSAYKKINELFLKVIQNGVHKTIVNACLDSFEDDTSLQLIRAEFIRMGLKYNGEQWALEGRFNRRIITRQPTIIRNNSNAELEVPENTMLGIEVESVSGITTFRDINRELLTVPTKHINYV